VLVGTPQRLATAVHAIFFDVGEGLIILQRLYRMRLSMRHVTWRFAIVSIMGVIVLLLFATGKQ
jgi:hypothetical protein